MARRTSPFDGFDMFAALAEHPHGITQRELARHLGISPSTASRHLAALREDGWLQAMGSTGLIDPDHIPSTTSARWTLNPDRPGFDVLLDWLYIERGIDVDTTRRILHRDPATDRLAFEDHLMTQRPTEADQLLDRAHALLLSKDFQTVIPPELYRDAAQQARPFWHFPGQHNRAFQFLYHGGPTDRAERYRDYIHLMIHLDESLPPFPNDPNPTETDTRPHLVVLIQALTGCARQLTLMGDFFSHSDTLGYARNHHASQLARWAYDALADHHQPPWPVPHHFPLTREQALDHQQKLHATLDEITSGQPDKPGPNSYLNYGGTPSTHELGTAGEGLLAFSFYQQAHRATQLLRRLENLDSMTPVLKLILDTSAPSQTLPPNPLDPTSPLPPPTSRKGTRYEQATHHP